jgi:glucokinase
MVSAIDGYLISTMGVVGGVYVAGGLAGWCSKYIEKDCPGLYVSVAASWAYRA